MKQQSGFTLIELIMVIVILGILAATALPKFVDIKADAELAAIRGVAGAVTSAFAINNAGRMVNTARGYAVAGSSVNAASAVGSVMEGGIPAGYVIPAAASITCTAAGQAHDITVSNSSFATHPTAAATLVCTG